MRAVPSDRYGTLLIDALDEAMKNQRLDLIEPWFGILHNCIDHPPWTAKFYGAQHDFPLWRLVETPQWHRNLKTCRGLFCLANHSAEFLRNATSNIPIRVLTHATARPNQLFTPPETDNMAVLMIGHWMRDMQAFFDLQATGRRKLLLSVPTAFNYAHLKTLRTNDTVTVLPRQPNDLYDEMLATNVVFLRLANCAACNTVIECIVRTTPIVINRLPALEEYLGHDYPLFYDTLNQAEQLLLDTKKLVAAHRYLAALDKERFWPETFAADLLGHVRSL